MSVKITTEGTMSREQALHRGAALMVLGALIFLAYAVVFFFLAFSSSGFEIGVATLNGVTNALDGTLQLGLGEPPRSDLPRYHHLRGRSCGGADRAEPSSARSCNSQAVGLLPADFRSGSRAPGPVAARQRCMSA